MTEPTNIDLVKMIKSILRVPEPEPKQEHKPAEWTWDMIEALTKAAEAANKTGCTCRSGSPDACPVCTDIESGEKYDN